MVIHTHIHTQIHTYIHTHTHTYIQDYDEAERVYKKALTIDPDDVTTLCNYGGFLKVCDPNIRANYYARTITREISRAKYHIVATKLCNHGGFLKVCGPNLRAKYFARNITREIS